MKEGHSGRHWYGGPGNPSATATTGIDQGNDDDAVVAPPPVVVDDDDCCCCCK